MSAAFARTTLAINLLKVKRIAIMQASKKILKMALNSPETYQTVDGALSRCAERFDDLQRFGICPKNLIMIATALLGTTAKNLETSYQQFVQGLAETVADRWGQKDFPTEITNRVRLATGNEADPRLFSSANISPKINPQMETYSQMAQVLAAQTTALCESGKASALASVRATLTTAVESLTDETLKSTLEFNLLQPLNELLATNNFDPRDQRTKLQNVSSLAIALESDEIQFLESIAQSEKSALSADAQKILNHLSSTNDRPVAA